MQARRSDDPDGVAASRECFNPVGVGSARGVHFTGGDGTLTTGIISSLGRNIKDESGRELEGMVQTQRGLIARQGWSFKQVMKPIMKKSTVRENRAFLYMVILL